MIVIMLVLVDGTVFAVKRVVASRIVLELATVVIVVIVVVIVAIVDVIVGVVVMVVTVMFLCVVAFTLVEFVEGWQDCVWRDVGSVDVVICFVVVIVDGWMLRRG